MVRTKHIYVIGVALTVGVLVGGVILLYMRHTSFIEAQGAAVTLGVSRDRYEATTAQREATDSSSFVARVRENYAPKKAGPAEKTSSGAESSIHIEEQAPVVPQPTPFPSTIVSEEQSATSDVETTQNASDTTFMETSFPEAQATSSGMEDSHI